MQEHIRGSSDAGETSWVLGQQMRVNHFLSILIVGRTQEHTWTGPQSRGVSQTAGRTESVKPHSKQGGLLTVGACFFFFLSLLVFLKVPFLKFSSNSLGFSPGLSIAAPGVFPLNGKHH